MTAASILDWQSLGSAANENQAERHARELEELYRIRRPELIRRLMRFGVDAAEAEDITQEVFLHAFDPQKPQKQPESLFYWTLQCARNLAITRYKRGKREMLAPAERWQQWEKTLADQNVDPHTCLYRQECNTRLACALAQLDPMEQQCLAMRSRGITFREIALTLDMPLQSAVYTTDTAIKKLKRKLQAATR